MVIPDIIQHLKENFTQNLLAQDIAKKFGLDKYKFSRLFKRETGTTFDLFVQRLRLSDACKRIDSGESLKSACYSSGFQSESQFQRVFKQRLGMTPKEYQKSKILNKEEIQGELTRLLSEYISHLSLGLIWGVCFADWLEKNRHYKMIGAEKFKKLS